MRKKTHVWENFVFLCKIDLKLYNYMMMSHIKLYACNADGMISTGYIFPVEF
jgi:hypothetical protein